MFDSLNDTQPYVADTKNRRNYFIVTTAVLGITLFSALIVSLFAVDLNLGMGDGDMSELIAPVEIETQTKLPDTEQQPQQPKAGKAGAAAPKIAMRADNVARIDESPSAVPTTVSTTQNSGKARLDAGKFQLGAFDSDPGTGGSGRNTSGDGTGDGTGLGDGTTVAKADTEADAPAPPPVKPVVQKPVTQAMGVVNGRATSLPLPAISAAAKMARAGGTVSVQVVVDEKGNVISANAVAGNVLLRAASEAAARSAKFSQTLLAGVPVKISGVINYNFATQSAE